MCKNTPEPLPILLLEQLFLLSPSCHFCHIERAGWAMPTDHFRPSNINILGGLFRSPTVQLR
jgi:hypothetical protein